MKIINVKKGKPVEPLSVLQDTTKEQDIIAILNRLNELEKEVALLKAKAK